MSKDSLIKFIDENANPTIRPFDAYTANYIF